MQQSRRLVLVRHAEAEQAAPSDLERVLSGAGLRTAADVGAHLRQWVPAPDHALVSAALRARQTWEVLAEAAGWTLEPEVSEALYGAEPDSALDLVRELPSDVSAVVVVGHNPTMASLAQTLDDGRGAERAVTGLLTGGFPPGAAALFELTEAWTRLDWAGARLVEYRGSER